MTLHKRGLSGTTSKKHHAAEIPYNSSVTCIAIFAIVSPFATVVLQSILNLHTDANDNDDRKQHRLLQIDEECIVKSTELQSALAIWDAVKITSIISGSVGVLCLVLYELFRRDPIVRKYCYDRKRLTQPDRSPPPLMTSRSLWRGYDEDSENNSSAMCRVSCCKVCPAILELVFLNLSKQYIQYSRAANEARIEREKRGVYCCRVDWYHRNCCSNYGRAHGEEEGFVTDEDGYTFYPEYIFGHSHIYKPNTLTYSLGNKRKSITASSLVVSNDYQGNVEARPPKTILDLFPEDDPRQYFASIQVKSTHTLLNSLMTFDPHKIRADSDSIESDPEDFNVVVAKNEEDDLHLDGDGVLKIANTSLGSKIGVRSQDESGDREKTSDLSSCDNNEQGDTNDVGDSTQQNRVNSSKVTSHNGSENLEELKAKNVDVDESVRNIDLGYPHKYILLPPGFHSWEEVTAFIANFFFISSMSRWCRKKMKSQIPIISSENGAQDSLPSPGKDLEEGEKELLRCAGLDTYLLIRSARFGFDVTFYPFLVSCVTVLPIYKHHDIEAGGSGNAYMNLTIAVIPNGSKTMIWIVLFTLLLYLYILRRLWIEWEGKTSS